MATQEQVSGDLGTRRTGLSARLGHLRDAFRRPSEEDLPEGVFLHRTGGFGGIDWRNPLWRPSEQDRTDANRSRHDGDERRRGNR